ncbi:MAG: DUF2817 domain-containing protein [Candidatus Zixiibacteriota bacterium]|nr:MAG: DUF2817 domain-containing protein [candidate division Zixibacteria bacterium]
MPRLVLTVLLALGLLSLAAQAADTRFFDRTPHRVHLPDEAALRELAALNLEVDRASVAEGRPTVEVYLNLDEVNLLRSLGYRLEAIPNEGYEGFLRWQAERAAGVLDETDDYHTYETMVAELQGLAAAHPSLCQLYNIGPTVQGRALWFMKISDNVAAEEDELEFRYVAAMHGDEVVGKEMCMYLINHLVSNYGVDPQVTQLVDDTEIWILPSMNPDGTAAGSRYNANGVDLNRNFPDRVDDPVNTTAGRQIETADVMNWGFAHYPVMSANFHGGALVANYPWDACWDPQANKFLTDNNDWISESALTYTATNLPMWNNNSGGFFHGTVNGVDWYQLNGGLQDWSYHWMGDMDITMEISTIKWPSATTLPGFWNDNRQSMLNYMQFAHRGLRGLVTDTLTGQPLDATVMIQGRDDHAVFTDPDVGDWHYPLMPGTYNVDIASWGYWPKHVTGVTVAQGAPTRVDAALEPADLMNFYGTIHNVGGGYMSAQLILLDTPYDTAVTNAMGIFSFPNVYEGEYTLRVRSFLTGALVDIPVVLTSGMAPFVLYGPQPLVNDGFETGLGAWTPQGTWGLSGNAYSGSQSLSDSPGGSYGSSLNISCTYNNTVNLADFDFATLSYRTRFNCETNYDTLFAEVSTNGTNWTPVAAHNSRQDGWSLESHDLSAYAGSATALRLRYRLWTDASVTRDGGFLDEVRLSAASLTPVGGPGAPVEITLTPVGAPIQIPPGGGQFTYNAQLANVSGMYQTVNAWIMQQIPGGTWQGPMLGPVTVGMPAGANVTRSRFQNVPSTAAAGTYTYVGYTGQYASGVKWDSSYFTYTKLSGDGEAMVHDWACTGEPFPGEVGGTSPVVSLPQEYLLSQNFPNPFNPSTEIHFALPEAGRGRLTVYNTAGQAVAVLADGRFEAGWHRVTWDASGLATGLYLYRLEAGGKTLTQKAVLVK